MTLTPFSNLITASIPLSLSAWRIEEGPAALPIKAPAVPVKAKPATTRMVNPACYAVSISRSGAAYADC